MKNNNETTFTLNNSLAAISATIVDNGIIASDGIGCSFHFFDESGNFCRTGDAFRPYRKIRKRECDEFFTALGCCERSLVYFLDCNLNEYCVIELETENGCSCSCNCGCDEFTELTDASITRISDENYIIGAFRKSAYLFDMNGKRLEKLCETAKGELLTDFVSIGQNTYAMGTLQKNNVTVSVFDNGKIQSAFLEKGFTLRMLMPSENREIFGLFGNNYIYNKIIKIYSDGILSLPR